MTTLATFIRDEAFRRLTVGTIAANWTSTAKLPIPTVQSDQLPRLAVYLVREIMNTDGDGNVSVPRFISDVTLGISVLDEAEKPSSLDGSLDTLIDLIEDTLLQDISFVSLKDADGRAVIESFEQIQRSFNFPQLGESYYAEARLQMTVRYRCYFEPVATTPLAEVDVHVSTFDDAATSGQLITTIANLDQ
ncbi:hypothetical protein [Bradyrhizobium japonicum]|uniref:hypothetical protein n=1 Tax=Bradyrhizobium japonicum TaxID=375 RepID=UPI00040832E6|nr:hypothetical protein [Bradyrhizobium japonicum]